MACAPCQKGRTAAVAAVRSVATGDIRKAATEAAKVYDAVAEKAEALRIRAMTRRR